MHPCAHCSGQDMETTKVSCDGGMHEEVVHTYSQPEKRQNTAICSNVDGDRRTKSGRTPRVRALKRARVHLPPRFWGRAQHSPPSQGPTGSLPLPLALTSQQVGQQGAQRVMKAFVGESGGSPPLDSPPSSATSWHVVVTATV